MSGVSAERCVASSRRPSVPGPGVSVSSLTEERAVHIRRAVAVVEAALREGSVETRFSDMFGPRACDGEPLDFKEPAAMRAAWAIVSQRVLGRLAGVIGAEATLKDAEDWFSGRAVRGQNSLVGLLGTDVDMRACTALERVAYDSDFAELLPYILDVHGPGSRASVMRDPGTQKARTAKRQGGVFYTPADVAEYQAGMIADQQKGGTVFLRCLDPACGSGVYLRAMLRVVTSFPSPISRTAYVTQCLYGLDVIAQAIEACCFVLLHDCMVEVLAGPVAPWFVWHAIRLNFACVDALTVTRESGPDEQNVRQRTTLRTSLLKGKINRKSRAVTCSLFGREHPPAWDMLRNGARPIHSIFPEAGEGFELLLGNPPYAPLGKRQDYLFLSEQYDSLGVSPSSNDDLYPLFIEMMWRLTKPGRSAASLVVPLSIAYHGGAQFKKCRHAMTRQGGRWRFAFFDREPHALFGEDVKTRNAILFRDERPELPPRGERSVLETSPMLKWTSRTRARLFSSIKFTPLNGLDISRGIPKLDGPAQSRAAVCLMARANRLATFARHIGTVTPADTFTPVEGEARVFLGGTAYNFLNVFREHQRHPSCTAPLSTSGVTAIHLRNEDEAWQTLAILSSRLVFWWWHVHCDGFHVPKWFIEGIPFDRDSFSTQQRDLLVTCGRRLWSRLQDHQICSVNGGRLSIAYRPLRCEQERNHIDAILIEAVGLEQRFAAELRRFVRQVVVVDETDRRRSAMQDHFKEEDYDSES